MGGQTNTAAAPAAILEFGVYTIFQIEEKFIFVHNGKWKVLSPLEWFWNQH